MIVNPQVFNYRLAIGTLLAAFVLIAVYGVSRYNDLTAEKEFLQQENKLLQTELNKILIKYDTLGSENLSIKSNIEAVKQSYEVIQDSLDLLKADVATIPKYRNQIANLKKENINLRSNSDETKIKALVEEQTKAQNIIKAQNNIITTLAEEKDELEETIEGAKLIYANSFDATIFRKRKSGKLVETTKASKAEFVEVCFVIAENPLATKGKKELYIQILGPDNNVLADQGSVDFGDSSLIYSSKVLVDYNKETKEVCASVRNDDTFKKGKYYISVFEKERKLGHTQIDLQ